MSSAFYCAKISGGETVTVGRFRLVAFERDAQVIKAPREFDVRFRRRNLPDD
jgi:hypothetical protein